MPKKTLWAIITILTRLGLTSCLLRVVQKFTWDRGQFLFVTECRMLQLRRRHRKNACSPG